MSLRMSSSTKRKVSSRQRASEQPVRQDKQPGSWAGSTLTGHGQAVFAISQAM
jgi:hypothetical protein